MFYYNSYFVLIQRYNQEHACQHVSENEWLPPIFYTLPYPGLNALQSGIQNGHHEKIVCTNLKKFIIWQCFSKKLCWRQTGWSQDQGPLTCMWALTLVLACLQLCKNTNRSVSPLKWIQLTLSPLAVNFEDRWWPLQTIWIQMKPHKMWGFIWDPNCLKFRLYISKIFGRKQWLFAYFKRKKYLKKLPSMQRVNAKRQQGSYLYHLFTTFGMLQSGIEPVSTLSTTSWRSTSELIMQLSVYELFLSQEL